LRRNAIGGDGVVFVIGFIGSSGVLYGLRGQLFGQLGLLFRSPPFPCTAGLVRGWATFRWAFFPRFLVIVESAVVKTQHLAMRASVCPWWRECSTRKFRALKGASLIYRAYAAITGKERIATMASADSQPGAFASCGFQSAGSRCQAVPKQSQGGDLSFGEAMVEFEGGGKAAARAFGM
jgi:hypothetical protein